MLHTFNFLNLKKTVLFKGVEKYLFYPHLLVNIRKKGKAARISVALPFSHVFGEGGYNQKIYLNSAGAKSFPAEIFHIAPGILGFQIGF